MTDSIPILITILNMPCFPGLETCSKPVLFPFVHSHKINAAQITKVDKTIYFDEKHLTIFNGFIVMVC